MNKRKWGGGEREKKKRQERKTIHDVATRNLPGRPIFQFITVIIKTFKVPNLWLTTLNNINITEYTEYTL